MSTQTQDPPTEGQEKTEKKVHPFIAGLADNLTVKALKEEPKPKPESPDQNPNLPLHERLEFLRNKKKPEGEQADPETQDEKPVVEIEPGDTPGKPEGGEQKPPEPGDDEHQDKPKPKRSRLIKIDDDPTPEPQSTPAPEPAPKPGEQQAQQPEGEDDSDLNEAQLEQLKLLEYAAEKNPDYKGKAKKFREYYKREAEWASENPDASDDEIREFQNRHMPKVSTAELRKIERQMIADEVRRELKGEIEPELAELKRAEQLRSLRAQKEPKIAKVMSDFEKSMTDAEAEVPGGHEPYFAPLAETLKKKGDAEAMKAHPIEYDVYTNTVAAAREYMELVNGLKQYDANNRTHGWLSLFIQNQERAIAADPARSVRKGKQFLPQNEYYAMAQSNPAKISGYFTLGPDDIINSMMVNAHELVKSEFDRLEAAGFQRPGKAKANHQEQQPAQKTEQVETQDDGEKPPKAGGSPTPGSSVPPPPKPKISPFWNVK